MKLFAESFLDPITKQIVTFNWVGKPLKLGTEKVYDPAVIYGRVLGLHSSPRSININDILVHEPVPFATAMFDTPIETKITKSKCDPAVIYGGVFGLQTSPRSINITDILVHELAPFATAMFNSTIETKITKSKCNLNSFR